MGQAGDASRLAFGQTLPDPRAASAVAFLGAAEAYYESRGVTVVRVMTDKVPAIKRSPCATPVRRSA